MNLFLATSFSGQVDSDNKVIPEFRKYIEDILSGLRSAGLTVFCAIEHENWIVSDKPPEVGVKMDLAEIDKCDIFLALVHDKPSAGVQFEMGYATANGKKVIVATNEGAKLAYFNQGLVSLNKIQHISFNSPDQIVDEIRNS